MALSSSNVTSGFIDLATYDELEKYMYGGDDATAYFVRETRKATWFTQVPVCLNKSSGDSQFGQNWSASISRSGDYLLNLWLEVEFPFLQAQGSGTNNDSLRWVQNLMHNLALLAVSIHPEAIVEALETWVQPLVDEDYNSMTPMQKLIVRMAEMGEPTIQDLNNDEIPDDEGEITWEYELLLDTSHGQA